VEQAQLTWNLRKEIDVDELQEISQVQNLKSRQS